MANLDDCFEYGKIIKPHGLKGELMVLLISENADQLKNLKSVYLLINQKLVPFGVEKITIQGKNKATLKLDDVKEETEAEELTGALIYLPLEKLPVLKKDQFYYHQIIGYVVIDRKIGEVGIIDQIYEMPGQDLIAVSHHGNEVLIPMSDDIVLHADHTLKTLQVELPDGLIDLYTDKEEEKDDDED